MLQTWRCGSDKVAVKSDGSCGLRRESVDVCVAKWLDGERGAAAC